MKIVEKARTHQTGDVHNTINEHFSPRVSKLEILTVDIYQDVSLHVTLPMIQKQQQHNLLLL